MWKKAKDFLLEMFFPATCLNCRREGSYLCEDCQALLNISGFHQECRTPNLKDLYFPLSYRNPLVKNLIKQFKYEPFIKELCMPFSSLIIAHFQLMDNKPDFDDFVLIPVPLSKKKLKWRGFNQAEEIGKNLARFLKIELLNNVLIKNKETPPQAELSGEERKNNIRGVFEINNKEEILGRKIILLDDVYTTGATLEECAFTLKRAGSREIIGLTLARE